MIKINVEQGSEAWYQERCGRITGTRFKTLISHQTSKGYRDLILEVAGEIITGEIEESYSNDIMERGKDLEPDARKLYEEITGFDVEQVGLCIPDEDSPYFDYVGISPDGLIYNIGLEIKCPMRKTHLYYMQKNRLPVEYVQQVQAALFVTGFERWDFMSYYPGMKPFIVSVVPDLELFDEFKERLDRAIIAINDVILTYASYGI